MSGNDFSAGAAFAVARDVAVGRGGSASDPLSAPSPTKTSAAKPTRAANLLTFILHLLQKTRMV